MRKIKHLTPKYVIDRLRTLVYEKKNREMPWLTIEANNIAKTYLLPSDIGVELGSGRSTVWLAKKVGQLTSIEHSKPWFEHVSKLLEEKKIGNVEYRLAEPNTKDQTNLPIYYNQLRDFQDASLDFCLIDGLYRDECTRLLIDKLRPGGVMIIDNVNRYLPSESCSPDSIAVDQPPQTESWRLVYQEIGSWRKIWTSTGVTDTAFFFKPLS